MKNIEELSKKIKLTETEKEIHEYMVENLDVLPKLSSRKLAEKTYTSPTTIVRFVKKLGYQNYNDFKYNIISKLKNNNEESQITSHEKALSVLNKVEKIQIEAMNDFKNKISLETFQEIIDVCYQHQYIDIIANDCNAILGKYALHYLSSLGKMVHVYHETNQQIYASMNVPHDHLVIIISKYALHETLLNCALTLKRRHIKTIAITNHQENTLSKRCDYVLAIPFYTNKDRFDELQFHMTVKYIFDCLFSTLYSYDIEKAKQISKIHTAIFFDKM
ncbi:MAG: MurR/RpiR family transcriptional regulator [Coprobacillus sp.]|nr:MurR/RpiR family transcriptional regulator [Coprobacillus sp.]